MIVDFILMSISVIISIFAIIYVSLYHENFASKLNALLIILIYLFVGIIYFISFSLSTITYYNKDTALILWKHSILIRILAMGLLISIHSFIIDYRKTKFIYGFVFSFLGGIIVSLSFFPNSFEIIKFGENYIILIQNPYLLIFIMLFDIILVILMCFMQMRSYSKIQNKELGLLITISTFCFAFIILTYTIFIVSQNILCRYLHLISYLLTAALVLYGIIKKPDLFIELTNKIYNFIIFHRSGILLYNYNFETGKETNESLLKGSILIGINHILSNFIDKKAQLNLIKMQDHDIILEYDNKLNYALLLIVNKKNNFIERAVQRFMDKFAKLNKDKLTNLNGLIDTSAFKNAGEIINEFFRPYIT
jgi:hypothetical protein